MKIEIKNKKRFGIILSIVLVLVAMASGTYALFYNENVASNKEDFTTGMLSIVAKSKSDNINLTNALPMSDEDGLNTEPYVFTIENVGNLDYNFNIRLLSTSDNPINPEYIKLKIDDGEVTTLSNLTNSIIKENITLKAKEVMDVSIRIWLSSDTPNSEIGKSFNSRIVTEGQAVYTELNNEDGTLSNSEHEPFPNLVQYITRLYNDSEKTVVNAPSDASDSTKTIDYNYATSVNLMNDRLGGTTDSLDGGNIRYYGASPRNYIDIGDRTIDNEVILWRIIGVFDGKVRIVRDESIGKYSFDTIRKINYGYGINQWGPSGEYQGADLMKLLNPGYESNNDERYIWDSDNGVGTSEMTLINNSLWWNSEKGICYNSNGNEAEECDFTSIGLSEKVKNYMIDQTIYLGAGSNVSIYADQAYLMERGTTVFQREKPNPDFYDNVQRTALWTGKVGLINLSDYGYSTDLSKCTETINKYDNDLCKTDNWLLKEYEQWTITPDSSRASFVWVIFKSGYSTRWGEGTHCGREVYPVLMLSPDLLIKSGSEGTRENPYVLK